MARLREFVWYISRDFKEVSFPRFVAYALARRKLLRVVTELANFGNPEAAASGGNGCSGFCDRVCPGGAAACSGGGGCCIATCPNSTTHVSCGSLFGIGLVSRRGRWRVIGSILLAWITTLPLAAAIGWLSWRWLAR